ncbi:MAG: PAS domain S-box protein [Clostridium sp.]
MNNNENINLVNDTSFYKNLFINNQEIMLLINPQTSEIKDCNLAACSFYGYSYNAMIKLKITDFNIITKEQVVKEMNIAKDEQRNRFYFKHKLSDGQVRDVEVHSTPVNLEGNTLLFSIVSDTTNTKIYSDKLRIENTVAQRTFKQKEINSQLQETNKMLDQANNLLSAILESSPEIIVFALDHNYCYLAFNIKHKNTMKSIWGKEIQIGMNMLDVIGTHEDHEKAKINFDRALSGESFTQIEEFGDENISRLFWQDFWSPMYSTDGNVIGLTCFVLDVTELKRTEKVLSQEKKFVEALLESVPGYLYVYDESGRLIRWNKKHEEMTGYSTDELSHMTIDKWFEGEDAIRVAASVKEVFSTGSGEVEADLIVKGGGKLHVLSNGVRLILDGKIYLTGVGMDITQRKKDEEKLKESERQFRNALEEAPIPIMLHAEGGEVLKISRTWTDITGYTLSDIPTTAVWAKKAYGMNKEELQDIINSLYRLSKRQYYGKFHVKTKDENVLIWDFHSAYIGKLQDGRKMVMSVAIDVTEQQRLKKALEQEKEFLETTLISVGDGVISTDNKGNILFLNRIAEYLTGWTQEQAIGKSIEEVFNIVNEFTLEKSENIVEKVLKSGKTHELGKNTILISKDGIARPIEDSSAPIMQQDGKIVGVVLVFRDFSEKKQREEEIEYLSYHDQLTGLYNRRFYEDALKRLDNEINLPMTIVMGDVNGLKLINDSFGHATGDQLLKKVAEVMNKGCRSDDIIARLGGDEFVIILPKTDTLEAEKIIKRINNLSLKEKLASITISISFGYETKNKMEEKIDEIFKNAEDHMYTKKVFEGPSMRGKTIKAIINTLHEKNRREEEHSHRVSSLCKSMGNALDLTEKEIQELKVVGLLHDIGKIAIDENILNKPGKLTDDEWSEIKRHPEIGYRILNTVNDMADMANYVLYHHERWDGKGYPKGLKGDEIPFVSRIITIADAYDAMTSERSYQKALSEEAAIDELKKNAGIQFDPKMVSIFIEKVLVQGTL